MTTSSNSEASFTRLITKLETELRKVVGTDWDRYITLVTDKSRLAITVKISNLASHVYERLCNALDMFSRRKGATYCSESQVISFA